jgi:hypothetical protein
MLNLWLNKKYSEELTMAAAQMESLNSLYKVQLQSASRNAQINEEVLENNLKLKDQSLNKLVVIKQCLWRNAFSNG